MSRLPESGNSFLHISDITVFTELMLPGDKQGKQAVLDGPAWQQKFGFRQEQSNSKYVKP